MIKTKRWLLFRRLFISIRFSNDCWTAENALCHLYSVFRIGFDEFKATNFPRFLVIDCAFVSLRVAWLGYRYG